MEELKSIIGGQDSEPPLVAGSSASRQNAAASNNWCSSCEMMLSNFIALKQKIINTDSLIKMYQESERRLEDITKKYKQSVKSKSLVEDQLKLALSKDLTSFTDRAKLEARNQELKMVTHLKLDLYAADESRKLNERTIKELTSAENNAVADIKKIHAQLISELRKDVADIKNLKHVQQISKLRKELSEKNEAMEKLTKLNKSLNRRIESQSKNAEAAVRDRLIDLHPVPELPSMEKEESISTAAPSVNAQI